MSEENLSGEEVRENLGLPTVTIGIGNQKGGVGKTSMTVQLACALGEMGRRVCVIDLDVNAGATKHLGIKSEAFLGSFEVLADGEHPLDVAITEEDDEVSLPKGVHVICGSRKLEELESRLREKTSKFATLNDRLKPVLEQLHGHYDYILIDTPPSAPLPIILTYTAADYFLLVAIPEGLAIEGLAEAYSDIIEARQFGGSKVRVLGVVLGAIDRRTRLSRELIAYVEKEFKADFIKPSIPRSTVVPTAQTLHTTIFDSDPRHPVTDLYRELAVAIEKRLAEKAGAALRPEDSRLPALPTEVQAALRDEVGQAREMTEAVENG